MDTPFQPSIRRKIYLFAAVVVLISTSVMSWIAFRFARQSLTTQIHVRLETVAHDREAQIMSYVRQQKERVALVASRTRLRRYLRDRINDTLSADNFLIGTSSILRDAKRSTAEFRAISITDPQGRVVTTTDDEFLNYDFSGHPDYVRGRSAAHLGAPFKYRDRYHAYLTAPVKGNEGDFLGVVVVLLDVRILQAILSDTTGLGSTGEVLVAKQVGERITYLLPATNQSNHESLPAAAAQAMVRAIHDSQPGRTISNYDGHDVLVAWRPLQYQPQAFCRWGMLVKINESEAYAPITNLRRLQWSATAVLVALGIALAIGFARRFTSPILNMAETASAIADGKLDARVAVQSKDEIGQLGTAFNRMTDKLAESHATLESRVEQRTLELASANEKLELSNAELQQFAYVVSHDLKEPLRAVSSFAELLQSRFQGSLDEKADQYIRFIVDGSERMKRLIDDLLRYSRVATHGQDFGEVAARELVDEALKNLSKAISESKADVKISQLPTIYGDPGQLSRVFQNLIGNALKFRSDDRTPTIHITATQQATDWKFSVRDNGIGIKAEFAEQIFVIFQRLHSRDKFPGTGIGLAICQRIIQRHGGRIWVEPNEDIGCTFHFTIPQNPPVGK